MSTYLRLISLRFFTQKPIDSGNASRITQSPEYVILNKGPIGGVQEYPTKMTWLPVKDADAHQLPIIGAVNQGALAAILRHLPSDCRAQFDVAKKQISLVHQDEATSGITLRGKQGLRFREAAADIKKQIEGFIAAGGAPILQVSIVGGPSSPLPINGRSPAPVTTCDQPYSFII